MTTMFVQLRGVVYLLVLLHCCVCVAYAVPTAGANGGDGGADGDGTVVERTEHDEVVAAENTAEAWMKKVSEYLAAGKGYSSIWEGIVNSSNESSKLANSTALKVKDLLVEVDKKSVEGCGANCKLAEGDEKKIKELVQEVKEAVDGTGSYVEDTLWAKHMGSLSCDTWVDAVNRFNQSRVYYLSKLAEPNKTYWTREKIKLARISNKTYHELETITVKYGELDGLSTRSVIDGRERIEETKKTMEGVKLQLEGIKKKLKDDGAKIGEIVESVSKVVESCTNVEKVTGDWIKNRKLPKKKDVVAKMEAERKRMEPLITAEIKAEEERMVQEEQAKQDEAARLERERQEKLEEEQRLAREQERLAQEELERKKKAEEEEAEKRKADEKRAQEEKAKQDRERKDAEEKAREALEKKEKEQLERAAEEAKKKAEAAKKNDSSLGPALMHSPFLLILLCVLVCTLVC
ncbi:uncharacterized protein TM35_000801020 [Trypanosoma theileri]|uniref:Transglutaminase n=1 Tax=Trypanosoma theileri TaxID=67003 RepID=A0A1X0NEV9_9TRYP|nr:uncharacterized protein TM35_000801020 [Trypanosoma theileri]ORC82964.1 hypothetical protein TM35_000801020 [Trypanosoma theileri]